MALLPVSYLDAVVCIGIEENSKFRALATGFLAGFLSGEKNEQGQPIYRVFLVTNRHVFKDFKKVTLRFNLTEKGAKTYELILEDSGGKLWLAHQNEKADVAAMPININQLSIDGIKFSFLPEEQIAFLSTIREAGISQGDGVFVLGFPMSLAGKERNYVIIRSGIIARMDEEILNSQYSFLIDSSVFPGNSGSPVILKPELASLQGTKAVNRAYIIGVVSGYLPYKEKAISEQTGEVRIVFIENSGIASVVPMDFVKETVQPFMDSIKEKSAQK